MKKNILSLFLLSSMMLSCSGGSNQMKFIDAPIEENVRNYYEIFVRSFYDSNNDGIGDLNGITQKLDYIKSLGYNGIWLTPINKAYSYHKYDVIDYYAIDPEFGTMEDFENLILEAKKRGIKIIMDLVVNHTSHMHPWFLESVEANLGKKESEYKEYYNFSNTFKSNHTLIESIYYESQFVSSMPDLNLDSEKVKNEVKNIIDFYIDKGVSGFRLDTVINYFTGNSEKNAKFIEYIVKCAKEKDPNCYIVAEAWTNTVEISTYYKTGIDSCFAFGTGSSISVSLNISSASTYISWLQQVNEMSGSYIPAPFIGNHDIGRTAGILGRRIDRVKFGYGLLGMMNGNLFSYYGDEIGMIASGVNGTNHQDKAYRTAMLWDNNKSDGFCKDPDGVKNTEYIYPSVKEQIEDENSILNYYKKVNYLRNNYQVITKGEVEVILCEKAKGIIKKTYNGESIYIAINFSLEPIELEIEGNLKLFNSLVSDNSSTVTFNDNKLNLSGYSIALLK